MSFKDTMVNVPGESTAYRNPLDTTRGLEKGLRSQENSSLGPGSGSLSDTANELRAGGPSQQKKLEHVGEAKGGLWLCLEPDAQTAWTHVTQIWETRSRRQDRNTSFIFGVVLASPQPKCTERRTVSRVWGQTLGTQMQNFSGGISVSRKDGELSPGERARKLGCPQKGEKAQAGAKEEEDAGTQCLVYHKHISAC